MAQSEQNISIYLEIGSKKTFAGALDWPGWCRSGSDSQSAVQALFDSGSRYAEAVASARLDFKTPIEISNLITVEQLEGNATTDFGAPGVIPAFDTRQMDEVELDRAQKLLQAVWQTFDQAVQAGAGKELRKGPRGGGRELDKIIRHVLEAEAGYLNQIGWKFKLPETYSDPRELMTFTRQSVLEGMAASARGELPALGPRGGQRWPARYFVRRLAWHALDHAWEIEDRSGNG